MQVPHESPALVRANDFVPPQTAYPPSVDCGANGTVAYCSSRCEETCQYKSRGCPPRVCGGPCVCKMGYIINEALPGCVLRADCHIQQLEVPSYQVTSLDKYGANYGHFPKAETTTRPTRPQKAIRKPRKFFRTTEIYNAD